MHVVVCTNPSEYGQLDPPHDARLEIEYTCVDVPGPHDGHDAVVMNCPTQLVGVQQLLSQF